MSQSRNAVTRFEDLLQNVVEGTFGRIFRSRLQPVELSRKLERAMDENLIVSAGRRIAPNAYVLYVSQADYTRFQQFMLTLLTQLQDRAIAVARQRGYTLTTKPAVALKVDQRLVTGEVRVEANLLDNAQLNSFIATNLPEFVQSAPRAPSEAPPPEATQVIGPQAAPVPPQGPPPVAGPMPYAALIERTPQGPGHVYQINREVIHIGRHTSNDIVINDRRVSRYHAEIRYERGQFVIYDLGSLNGVSINGSMTRQATLRNGDVLAFGNFSFVFERR